MTCGVYGLVDPDTGVVRWVATSRNIEAACRQHRELSWKRSPGQKVGFWLVSLNRAGKAPILQILQECGEADFNRVKREQVGICELVGGADLNVNLSANVRNKARSRKG